ncbi:hypothetical protein GJ496_010997 [Pomphorhynchus laevis]|nr:hypothetical protein GJ496_010997 [Pomphorhynchus laevis]
MNMTGGNDISIMSYTDIVATFNEHFKKTAHVVSARYNFNQTRMKSGQSYADLIVQLRGKSRFCDFYQPQITNERHAIDERILDVIVTLTPHQYVRNAVLQITNHSLDDVIRIGTDNSRRWHGIQCKRCDRNHRKEHDCPASMQRCIRCKILGYFAIRCRRSSKTLNGINAINQVGIPIINVEISGKHIYMEYDTGASVNVLPISIWRTIGRPTLRFATKLATYDNHEIILLRACTVTVTCQNQVRKHDAVVVDIQSRSIFVRTWITACRIEWPECIRYQLIVDNTPCASISS